MPNRPTIEARVTAPGGNGHAPPHPFGPVTRLTVTPAETAPSEIAALAAAAEARLTAAKPRIERFLITMQYRTRHAKRNPTRPRHRHTAPTRPWDTTRGTKRTVPGSTEMARSSTGYRIG